MTATIQRVARPREVPGAVATFGRTTPRVRRDPPVRPHVDRREGLEEGTPFLLFGAACIGLGFWAAAANPDPGNPIALWALLVVVGACALAGGILGAFLPSETEAEVESPPLRETRSVRPADTPRPRRPDALREEMPVRKMPARNPWNAESSIPLPRHRPRWEAPAPAADPPWDGDLPPPSSLPRSEPWEDPSTARWTPRANRPTRWSPELGPDPVPYRRDPDPETGREADEGDAVLRHLDDLSRLVRRPPAPGATTAAPDRGTAPTVCVGCATPIPADLPAGRCTECQRPVCAGCGEVPEEAGRATLCPTCAVLQSPMEPPGPRRPEGRSRLPERSRPAP